MNRHNAPPVVYPLGRSRFLGGLLLGVWFAGMVSALLWCSGSQASSWRLGLSGFSILAAGAAARAAWQRMPTGQLAWDGQFWQWEGAAGEGGLAQGAVSVIMDIQHGLLLRLENQAGTQAWLWLEKKILPARWLDLRRAVYSPHRQPAALAQHDFLASESFSLPPVTVAVSATMPARPACPPAP